MGDLLQRGHVLRLAAAVAEIRAIVAQVPFLEPGTMLRRLGWRLAAAAVWHGLLDRLGSSLGRPARTLPIVAAPGQLGCLNAPGARPDYLRLVPPGAAWTNACAARSVLALLKHTPLEGVEQVRCPALVHLAEDDPFVSAEATCSALARAPAVEVVRIPGGHFDVYFGETFERAVAGQVRFLRRHLGLEDGGVCASGKWAASGATGGSSASESGQAVSRPGEPLALAGKPPVAPPPRALERS